MNELQLNELMGRVTAKVLISDPDENKRIIIKNTVTASSIHTVILVEKDDKIYYTGLSTEMAVKTYNII